MAAADDHDDCSAVAGHRQGGADGRIPHDEATCEGNGRSFRATSALGAEMALARILVAAGCPDQPWETFTPQGTRSLRGRSLRWLAGRTLGE
jgi:hypothetical protein